MGCNCGGDKNIVSRRERRFRSYRGTQNQVQVKESKEKLKQENLNENENTNK